MFINISKAFDANISILSNFCAISRVKLTVSKAQHCLISVNLNFHAQLIKLYSTSMERAEERYFHGGTIFFKKLTI